MIDSIQLFIFITGLNNFFSYSYTPRYQPFCIHLHPHSSLEVAHPRSWCEGHKLALWVLVTKSAAHWEGESFKQGDVRPSCSIILVLLLEDALLGIHPLLVHFHDLGGVPINPPLVALLLC